MKTLPEYCFTKLPTTGELIMIQRGVMGYSPQRPENLPWDAANISLLNERLGVTKGQEEAMKNGSMFGWDIPGADPNNFDDEGNWIKE